MPYLPAGPLALRLRLANDPRPLHGGPHYGRTGLEAVAHELARIRGCSVGSAHRELRRIVNGRVARIWDSTADAMACALGLHPVRIWPDWYERTDGGVREVRRAVV